MKIQNTPVTAENKYDCSVNSLCFTKGAIYKVNVNHNNTNMVFTGYTRIQFKNRFYAYLYEQG